MNLESMNEFGVRTCWRSRGRNERTGFDSERSRRRSRANVPALKLENVIHERTTGINNRTVAKKVKLIHYPTMRVDRDPMHTPMAAREAVESPAGRSFCLGCRFLSTDGRCCVARSQWVQRSLFR